MSEIRNKNRKITLILGGLVVLMFGFGFAMVPLYNLLCEATGTQSIALRQAEQSNIDTNVEIDHSRLVTVKFDASVNPNLPWDFSPETHVMEVHPGQIYSVNFKAGNRSNSAITGQAIPSVAPWQATPFFSKLECFCFNRQTLDGNEHTLMPLRFMVTPDLPEDIHSLTLSYSLLKLQQPGEGTDDGSQLPSIAAVK